MTEENRFVRDLIIKGTHSVRQLSTIYADQRGNYRFLYNDNISTEAIVKSMSDRCTAAVKGKVVLSIQDTTEVDLYRHVNRIKHDGSIGLIIAAKNGLGFMNIPLW